MASFGHRCDPARTTLLDVAQAANVHTSTVSRALRGDPIISPKTRQHIQQIAHRLGYQRDPLVSALMCARRLGRRPAFKANLAFLIAEPKPPARASRSWIGEVYSGAERQARQHGYAMEAFWLADMRDQAEAFGRVLRSRSIQGLVLPPEHEAPLPFPLPWEKFSVVSLHCGPARSTPRFHQVVSDHFHSMLEACRECHERGYERLGLILRDRPDTHHEYGRIILGAFYASTLDRARDRGIPPLLVNELAPGEIGAWIRQHQPDAVILAGGGFSPRFGFSQLAAGLAAEGLSIGRDVGFLKMSDKPDPDMAVVDERTEIIGETATDILIDMVQRNVRGIPTEPMSCHVAAVIHSGRSLPRRRETGAERRP